MTKLGQQDERRVLHAGNRLSSLQDEGIGGSAHRLRWARLKPMVLDQESPDIQESLDIKVYLNTFIPERRSFFMTPLSVRLARWIGVGLGSLGVITSGAIASERVPTARYASGESVDLALIIQEWQGKHPDIPVFACVCAQPSCNLTAAWPFRRFNEYQFTVMLGPFNAMSTENQGFNCHDTVSGRSPSRVLAGDISDPTEPGMDITPPGDPEGLAQIEVQQNGTHLRGRWRDSTVDIDVRDWNINLIDGVDCSTLTIADEQVMNAHRVVGEPSIDLYTEQIAVAVELDYCALTTQSAVFIIDPQPGGYALYRAQVPGDRPLPDEFSSYPLSSVADVDYWGGNLMVRQFDASGTEALVVFTPGDTPAGDYAGCVTLAVGESPSLCPAEP